MEAAGRSEIYTRGVTRPVGTEHMSRSEYEAWSDRRQQAQEAERERVHNRVWVPGEAPKEPGFLSRLTARPMNLLKRCAGKLGEKTGNVLSVWGGLKVVELGALAILGEGAAAAGTGALVLSGGAVVFGAALAGVGAYRLIRGRQEERPAPKELVAIFEADYSDPKERIAFLKQDGFKAHKDHYAVREFSVQTVQQIIRDASEVASLAKKLGVQWHMEIRAHGFPNHIKLSGTDDKPVIMTGKEDFGDALRHNPPKLMVLSSCATAGAAFEGGGRIRVPSVFENLVRRFPKTFVVGSRLDCVETDIRRGPGNTLGVSIKTDWNSSDNTVGARGAF